MAYVQGMGAWRPTSGAGSATNTAATAAAIAAAQAPSSPSSGVSVGLMAVVLIGGAGAFWYFKKRRK